MVSDRSVERLRRTIEGAIPERPFALEFWDGERLPATNGGRGATISFRSPQALSRVIAAPGELGLGRAYVTGEIDVDDLDAVIGLLGRWSPDLSAADKARIGAAAVRAAGLKRPPPPPAAELQPRRDRHSREFDSETVRHHYDVSNEFFQLFLDDSMTYSCAYFERPGMTLEEAQFAKLDLVCRKLELEPGKRVLDIGCGWGSFAIHAAREYGAEVTGITLSPPQAELARQRVFDAEVGDKVEIRILDYRDLEGSFDAVSSIGMIEHVGGDNIDEYAAVIKRVLTPDGRVLNHGITHTKPEVHIGDDFSERYVFPGGEIPPISRVIEAFERAGLETLHAENLRGHYAETLRHWAERLDSDLEKAERIAGPERLRVWRLYLRAARNSFETAQTGLFQTLFGHPVPLPAGGEVERRSSGWLSREQSRASG